jgi:hypothetical protein
MSKPSCVLHYIRDEQRLFHGCLCHYAKKYIISLCIDAEESERLEMPLVLFGNCVLMSHFLNEMDLAWLYKHITNVLCLFLMLLKMLLFV